MSDKKSIKFTIKKDGGVTIDNACGFGGGCVEATAAIEAKLGKVDEKSREQTAEFNKPVANEQKISA